MKIGYGYARNERDLRAAGADRVYLDGEKTMRQDRERMLSDLRAGDVVLLLKPGDLGAGRQLPALRKAISDAGCTIEVAGDNDPPKRTGPKPAHEWLPEVARLWHDVTVDPARPMALAEELGGQPISRNQMNRRYGPRSKPRRETQE